VADGLDIDEHGDPVEGTILLVRQLEHVEPVSGFSSV
jgi:hypothetical protein